MAFNHCTFVFFVLRRVVHYQSTGSLHSDSPSSTSVSPVPTSPSPTHTPPPPPPPLGSRFTPSPSTPQPLQQRPSSVLYNSGTLHKRWSSTGDFNNSGITSPTSTVIISNSVAVASRSVAIIWQVMFLVLVQYVIEGHEAVCTVCYWKTWSNMEVVFYKGVHLFFHIHIVWSGIMNCLFLESLCIKSQMQISVAL